MFNKVVQWHELGEVVKLHIEYNSSHFFIYLPNMIKIAKKFKKFWQKEFCTVFSETRCIYNIYIVYIYIYIMINICIQHDTYTQTSTKWHVYFGCMVRARVGSTHSQAHGKWPQDFFFMLKFGNAITKSLSIESLWKTVGGDKMLHQTATLTRFVHKTPLNCQYGYA